MARPSKSWSFRSHEAWRKRIQPPVKTFTADELLLLLALDEFTDGADLDDTDNLRTGDIVIHVSQYRSTVAIAMGLLLSGHLVVFGGRLRISLTGQDVVRKSIERKETKL